MYEDLLRDAGLSINEARVYEALLDTKDASVQMISLKAKVHRRNVYDSLAKLIEKGLTSELFIKGEKHFRATNPTRLIEFLKEKEERILVKLPEMQMKYSRDEDREEAYFYKGIEGFKTYLQLILEQRQTVYFIGAKAFWLDPRLKHYLTRFERERKKLGIEFKHIFDYEVKMQKPEILNLVGKPYKFFPSGYSGPAAVDVFGDCVVMFVGVKPGILDKEPLQFVLRSKRLADGYRKFFDFMWDNLAEE